MSVLGAPFLWWILARVYPTLGWDSNSWFVPPKKYNFVPLSDTAFDPHSRENIYLIGGVCMLADVQEIKRITGRTFT